MRSRTVFAIGVLLALRAPAEAHFFPKKATTLKAYLVQNYPSCTAPDATSSTGEAACSGPAEVDPSCVFSPKGLGLFSATITNRTRVALRARLSGLDMNCEGQTLSAAIGVRTTSDTCPTEHCTAVDREIVAGSCLVRHGRCAIDAVVATPYPTGAGSEMTILTCGVKNGPLHTFSCGIMVK